jgi:hypothetical protein
MKITIGNNTIQNKAPKVPYFAKRKPTGTLYLITDLYKNPPKCRAFNMHSCIFYILNIDEIEPIKQPVTFENEWE